MARANRTKYALLGMLSLAPMSGYDIRQFAAESLGHFWQESYGPIYSTLKRLLAEGLTTRRVEEGKGKPDRHVYQLTKKGRGEFRRWLLEPAEPQVPRVELLLKLFFGPQVPSAASLEHVRRHREQQRAALERLNESIARMHETYADSPYFPYWQLSVRAGQLRLEGQIAWCDEAEAALADLTRSMIADR